MNAAISKLDIGQERHTRMRFLAEILSSSSDEFNSELEIGAGFKLSDILANLDTAGKDTHF